MHFFRWTWARPYDICKISIAWEAVWLWLWILMSRLLIIQRDPGQPSNQSLTIQDVLTEILGQFNGRFVRMQGVAFVTDANSYQIDEMQVFGELASTCAKPANPVVSAITENTATVSWDAVAGAANGYYIKYKTPAITSWVTRTTSSLSEALGALSCGFDYNVEIQSLCGRG